MKEEKHRRKKVNIFKVYSILIFITILFMSIGYAEIGNINTSISGVVEAISQEGVFITDIKNISNINADITNSKINYFTETMVDSTIVLGDTSDSSITYEVSLYNNLNEDYLFIGVITDKADKTLYSNENIEFYVTGIEEYITTISPKSSLTFTITFKYQDGADISNNILTSKLNFRFKEIPKLVLSNENQNYTLNDIYPDYTPQEYEFTVSNYDETKTNNVPMTYYFEKTIDSPLTAKIYDENGNEVTGNISIGGDGKTQTTHTYTLKIIWDNSNPTEGIDYNSPEYANKKFNCGITLKAIPDDVNYLEYAITKAFSTEIKTAQFYFNASAEATNISIKNNLANVTMTINNYNSDTEFNVFKTNYEISIENNTNFTFSSGDEVIAKTISGGNKTEDSIDLEFTADMSNLNLEENLTLKIVSKSPYVTEIEIPINISIHTVTVTLNANGGTVSPSTITVYQSRTYADLPTPTWTGHTFNGWYTAKSGGTKIATTTIVTTTSSTQTLYAQWTSLLLADKVSVGDYVNYPVSYSNVETTSSDTHIASDSYTGWRVLSIDGSGNNKYVRLVSAGVPMTYRHAASSTSSGPTSVTNLTTNFFSIAISTSSANFTYNSCGFKTSSGGSVTTISKLKELFTNDYTQTSSSVPKVQAMTKADLDSVYGSTTVNVSDVRGNDLLAIPSKDQSSEYASYYLATATEGYYLWASYRSGYIVYTYGIQGIRPVVTLKTTVETAGQDSDGVWQLN